MPRLGRACALALVLALLPGCAKKDDVVLQTGAGKELAPSAIDADPLALLPGNAVGVLAVDAKAVFASQFGSKLFALLEQRMPLPASAGFVASRDLDRLYVSSYSMQGADVAGVAVGKFDQQKIGAAVGEKTPFGVPVTKSEYAGRTLYTVAGAGFCILTDHTALLGNDTGIRRALDRIHEGRVRRQLPGWMNTLLSEPGKPIVGGMDLRSNPVPDAARANLGFLNGLETLSLVGNFADPGLNFAGTLAYGDSAAAQAGAENVKTLSQTLNTYGPFLAMLGIPNPVQKLEAEAKDKQTEFVLGLDAGALNTLLDKAPQLLGVNAE